MNRFNRLTLVLAAAFALAASPLMMTGCDSLPGSRTQQTTVGGGAAGAILGAVIAKENRLIGALIGGALGAGAGYLIGAKTDWFDDDDDDANVAQQANQAVANAQNNPATPQQALAAKSADINNDGFVTLDEITAMERANLTDAQMITRLEAADQVYDLTPEQRQYLLDQGVSPTVVNRMLTINRETRDKALASSTAPARGDVIGKPQQP